MALAATVASALALANDHQAVSVTFACASCAHDAWWRNFIASALPNVLLGGVGIAVIMLSTIVFAARQNSGHRMSGSGSGGLKSSRRKTTVDPARHDNAEPVVELASVFREPPADARPSSDWASVNKMRANAEALLFVVRQIVADDVPDGAVRDVLIADLSVISSRLAGRELADALATGHAELAHAIYTQTILDLERARTLSRIERERTLEVVGGGEGGSPETVDEACAFLGVNSRASKAIVKKVVDALRQNWHPDHAGDEADRRTREERIKRINAAWDLIR